MQAFLIFPAKLNFGAKVFFVFSLVLSLTMGFPGKHAQAASITVNSTGDITSAGDGQCTLREAVSNANANTDTTGGDCTAGSGADTITFSDLILGQTITLGGTQLTLSSDITIDANLSGMTLSGNNVSRIFQITAGNTVVLTKLYLINGRISGVGGGILNAGNLTINDSMLMGNRATTFGGGIYNSTVASLLTVNGTTFRNNSVASTSGTLVGGGGIANLGTVVVNNSTFTGNSVTGTATNRNGGGIRNNTLGASVTLNNVTIVTNNAGTNGGGISDAGTFIIRNSIIANNTAPTARDCGGTVNADYSLIKARTGCTITGANNIAANVDPLLGPLDANGGGTITHPTLTFFPLDSSPVLNAGSNALCLATDQRGASRPVGNCDIGAVEKQTGEETDQFCAPWIAGTPHVFGADVNVTITPNTASNPGCITVLKRPVFAGGVQEGGEFPILWTVTAANSTFDVNVQFCYSDAELTTANVTDETSILIYHLESGAWQLKTTTTSPATNCVTTANVTSLSPWTIVGNGDAPTVVELQNLTARTLSPQSLAVVVLALLGLLAGAWVLHSRK